MYAKYSQQFPPQSPRATRLAKALFSDFPPEKETDLKVSFSPVETMYGTERKPSKIRMVTLRPREYMLLKEQDPIDGKVFIHLLANPASHAAIQKAQTELLDEHDFERLGRVLDVRENQTPYGAADWKIYPYAKSEAPELLKGSDTYLLKFRVVFWEKLQPKAGNMTRGVSLYDLKSVNDNLPFNARKLEVL